MTQTQYSRHRRTSLLPLASAPKRPCPTPQFGSLLQRRASQSAPPAIWVITPCGSPTAATPDFGETFEFPALRAVCAERLLLVGHSSKWPQNGSPRPSMVQSRSRRQRHHHHHHHHHHRTPQRRAPPPLSRPARRLTGARRTVPPKRHRQLNRAPQRRHSLPLFRPWRRLTGARRTLPPKRHRQLNRAPQRRRSPALSRPWRRLTGARRTLPPQRQWHLNRAPQRRCTPPLSRPWRRLTGARDPLPPHRHRPSRHPGVWISS